MKVKLESKVRDTHSRNTKDRVTLRDDNHYAHVVEKVIKK